MYVRGSSALISVEVTCPAMFRAVVLATGERRHIGRIIYFAQYRNLTSLYATMDTYFH